MGIKAVLYDEATGKIFGNMDGPESSIVMSAERNGKSYVLGTADMRNEYVVDGQITPRPENPAILDGHVLRGLPEGSVINIDGEEYPCPEPTAELAFELPGTYKVTVVCWPYLDKEFTVENPA